MRLKTMVTALLGTVALGALMAGAPVRAAEIDDLKKAIEALTKKVNDLESKQKEAAPQNAVTGGSFPGSFKLPGTDTSVKIGGYAKLDAIYDAKASTGDSVTFPSIPLDRTTTASRESATRIHARQSRVNVTTVTPTGLGEFKTFIEGDFFGSGGNEVFSNSNPFRLRHAYGQLGPVLAGQTWSNFMDLDSLPDTIDFNGPTGQSFARQAQIRYTHSFAPGTTLAVAIENPETDVTDETGVTSSAGNGSGAGALLDRLPDLTANFTHRGSWGHISLRGVARELRSENGASASDTTFGYGVGFGASVKTIGKDAILLHFNYGEGIGRYIQEAGFRAAAFNTATGALETQRAWGGIISYQHFWTDQLRSTAAYGHTEIDNENSRFAVTGTNVLDKQFDSVHANLIWSPIQRIDLGIEYIWGRREVEATANTASTGTSGTISRFQFGGTYRF